MNRAYSSSSEAGYIKPRSVTSKNPAVSALQDLLFYQLTGIGYYISMIKKFDKTDKITDDKISRLICLTNKNINFRVSAMLDAIKTASDIKLRLENLYKLLSEQEKSKNDTPPSSATFQPAEILSQMVSQANIINAQKNIKITNIHIFSMQEIIRQSLCSSANYFEHIKDEDNLPHSILDLFYEILNFLNSEDINLTDCENYALKAGELHAQILELLLTAYEKKYGFIERKQININRKKGTAILVAGEDFEFLKNLLEQTKDKEINIYTYGTMNYANVFPEFNKYKNLAGIYLGKYGDMGADIEKFPGISILTAGNLEEISDIYRGRVYSTEEISMLGITRVSRDDIETFINAAFEAPGFLQDGEEKNIEIGFSLQELDKYATRIYNLINTKKVKNILVFLGCNYFAEEKDYLDKLINILPDDTAFVALNCFCQNPITENDKSRVLNLGQYVNLFSFIRLLFAIAGKFKQDINDIPINITLNLKNTDSIASLLMFLSMGIKNIKINSDLPNYLTASLIETFKNDYELSKITNAKSDANNIISKHA